MNMWTVVYFDHKLEALRSTTVSGTGVYDVADRFFRTAPTAGDEAFIIPFSGGPALITRKITMEENNHE